MVFEPWAIGHCMYSARGASRGPHGYSLPGAIVITKRPAMSLTIGRQQARVVSIVMLCHLITSLSFHHRWSRRLTSMQSAVFVCALTAVTSSRFFLTRVPTAIPNTGDFSSPAASRAILYFQKIIFGISTRQVLHETAQLLCTPVG